jgi:hypothetical protein
MVRRTDMAATSLPSTGARGIRDLPGCERPA